MYVNRRKTIEVTVARKAGYRTIARSFKLPSLSNTNDFIFELKIKLKLLYKESK